MDDADVSKDNWEEYDEYNVDRDNGIENQDIPYPLDVNAALYVPRLIKFTRS